MIINFFARQSGIELFLFCYTGIIAIIGTITMMGLVFKHNIFFKYVKYTTGISYIIALIFIIVGSVIGEEIGLFLEHYIFILLLPVVIDKIMIKDLMSSTVEDEGYKKIRKK